MDKSWLRSAADRYEECNRTTLEWILSRRPLQSQFLDTKVNSITGANYGITSGLRGPNFTYGWIQGRGLEALVTFSDHYRKLDQVFSNKLLSRAKLVFDGLSSLFKRDEHINFLYDRDLKPIKPINTGTDKQLRENDLYTYSDAFAAKGLFAASHIFDPSETNRYEDYLSNVIKAVEDGRFQMDESQDINRKMILKQPNDYGPRMILLGSAGIFHHHGYLHQTRFANRFIDHVLEHHYQPSNGLLLNIPNHNICNIGHAIEFCGFALEHLIYNENDTRIKKINSILQRSLEIGLQGPGIALYLSAETGEATSPYFPWWPMPEATRACALSCYLGAGEDNFDLWRRADNAFFSKYWLPDKGYAFQTRNINGPTDYVPATPDLDPGYHTCLSFRRASETIKDYLARTKRS